MNSDRIRTLIDEKWHAMTAADVFKELDTKPEGLDAEHYKHRKKVYGLNALPVKKPPTLFDILLHQVLNPLIFILIAAAVASLSIGDTTDAIFILIVILLNTALGAYQEYNAERSAAGLQNLLKIKARVRRDAKEQEVNADDLVPGDLVLLESGNKVPADLRLIEVNGLTCDESFLTGESMAANKKAGCLAQDTGVSERSNMAYAGAVVTSGRALGIVTGTGLQTQVGLIAENVTLSDAAKPPLVIRMERFTKQISFIVVAVAAVLSFILYSQGTSPQMIFFFVVALAVSAIPEGLPVALTVALSLATSRMSKRNVIVRKLNAVESLGSCTVIASDKTGTLTVNQQTAQLIELPSGARYSVSGEGYKGEGEIKNLNPLESPEDQWVQVKKLAKLACLANEGSLARDEDDQWIHYGDAMDVAFLAMAYKVGQDPRVLRSDFSLKGQIPYESEKKFSAAFYDKNDKTHIALKGAVETVLELCEHQVDGTQIQKINKDEILEQAEQMAQKGFRVLAVAGGEYPGFQSKEAYELADIPALQFQGLVGFIDPLRPEVKDSVEKCKLAGIKVLMITGDHPATALAIAQELKISDKDQGVVSGGDLEKAGTPDSPAYEKLVLTSKVFARVSPVQKLEIVDVLMRNGEYVAVTGDGVNDAPAMRKASIGVAMGTGTDVAKEVSNMIVTDDNFASIVSGVEEGRFAYDNVRKVIYLLISTGAAEVFMFIAAIIAGLPLPLLAVQLLWLNLVTNGIQDVALAFEGGEPDAMERKPRNPKERIFNSQMVYQTLVSGLTMGVIAFGFWFYLKNFVGMDEVHARNIILLLMVFMQNIHAFNCRSEKTSAFKVPLKRNLVLVFGVLIAQGIHILSMQIPFMQNILRVEPVTFTEWIQILAFAVPLLIIMEIFKWVRNVLLKKKEALI